MISAGELRDRIDFLTAVTGRSASGEQVNEWNVTYSCRAKVQFLKGSRAMMINEIWNPSSVIVTVRKNDSEIDSRKRICWNKRYYNISAINTDNKDKSTTITADLINDGE